MKKGIVTAVVILLLLSFGLYFYSFFIYEDSDIVVDDAIDVVQEQVANDMHPSWDQDGDGLNDCEKEGTCDHTASNENTVPTGNEVILQKLMTAASVTIPETDIAVVLGGKTTEYGDFGNDVAAPFGTVTFGDIAMPYPYYPDETGGPDAVTTLAINTGGSGEFVYLAVFTPGESMWQMVDMVGLGDRVDVKDLKVVGEEITVVYNEHDTGQAMADIPAKEVVRRFSVQNDKIVEMQEGM